MSAAGDALPSPQLRATFSASETVKAVPRARETAHVHAGAAPGLEAALNDIDDAFALRLAASNAARGRSTCAAPTSPAPPWTRPRGSIASRRRRTPRRRFDGGDSDAYHRRPRRYRAVSEAPSVAPPSRRLLAGFRTASRWRAPGRRRGFSAILRRLRRILRRLRRRPLDHLLLVVVVLILLLLFGPRGARSSSVVEPDVPEGSRHAHPAVLFLRRLLLLRRLYASRRGHSPIVAARLFTAFFSSSITTQSGLFYLAKYVRGAPRRFAASRTAAFAPAVPIIVSRRRGGGGALVSGRTSPRRLRPPPPTPFPSRAAPPSEASREAPWDRP